MQTGSQQLKFNRIDPKLYNRRSGTEAYSCYIGTDIWNRKWEIINFNPTMWMMRHETPNGQIQTVYAKSLQDVDTILGGNPVSDSLNKNHAEVANIKTLPPVLEKEPQHRRR